ncbi:hypothetical protein P43SY_000547 [Pythium insidiosum]|uniref:glucan endo-1,3-beta-D-glucosidase n=1 Tax=Pythium insidiosum TaxID=114742 RepID=A0AAD5M897_PYTIN|nr:hypothetical protein P43SY_000547 [Pythium insidiosum]
MHRQSLLLLVLIALSGSLQALNVKLSGINYDFRQGPDWALDRCKGLAQVTKEMRLLQTVTNRVRVYSLSDCNVRNVLRMAQGLNMTVWLGMWVGNTTRTFDRELTQLKNLALEGLLTSDLIAGVNVGSEVLYRNDTTPEVLLGNMKKVKDFLSTQGIKAPVSITDTLGELYKNPKVIEAVDVVTLNQFPFWNKVDVEHAVTDMEAAMQSFANVTKDKPIVITETGWAHGGSDSRASKASPENAARYMKEFYLLAEKKGWKYYYFAGFDTPYRKVVEKNNDTVEANFGIFTEKGKMNAHYEQLTIPATKMVDGPVTPLTGPTLNSTRAPSSMTPSSSKRSRWMTLLLGALALLSAAS